MRVLLTGGGTSGHVNPALAIADIIKKYDSSAEFAYVGTEKGIEKKLVEKEGYPFYPIKIQGISRSLSLENIRTAYMIMTAPSKAKKIIEEFRPDVVIGTGGYVCWPPLKAAADMGIPCVLHESNSIPGLAVRRLQSKVDLLLTNFESIQKQIKRCKKVVRVGNPTRTKFSQFDKASARKRLGIPDSIKFVLLSFGGSLGAPALNSAAIDVMRDFVINHEDVCHFHAGGKRYYKNAMQMFAGYSLEKTDRLDLKEYIYDMHLYMAAADVIICRAGAMTLTELAILGKPAILIPSPYVVENHQFENANELARAGAAILIEEKDLTFEKINEAVRRIYEDKDLAISMSRAISQFANSDIERQIYGEITKLVKSNSKIKQKGR